MERAALFLLCFLGTSWASKDINIHINTKRWINYVSDKYLSFTIDPGTLYAAGKLSETSLNMARGLSPAYVRLGGPMTNSIIFEGDSTPGNFSISEDVWKDVNKFIKEAGLDLIVCLNGMQRVHGTWDSRNALELISVSDKYGYHVAWQLGYDIESMGKITGTELGRDIVRLRKILDGFEHYIKSPVLGPDIPDVEGLQQINFIKELLNQAAPALTALTVKIPNSLVSGSDSVDYGIGSVMNSLDTYVWPKDPMRGIRNVPKKPIWLAEPEMAKPNFDDAMLWMEKLGSAARTGCQVVMRQPSPVSFHLPTPDFWVSLLFKNLVGQGVLDTRMNNGSSEVSVFSHCTATVSEEKSILDKDIQYSKGSITIYGVNPSQEHMKLGVKVNMREEVAHIYILTTGDDKNSDITFLNGQKLMLSPTGELPIISPRIKPPSKYITVPPRSIFFAVLPEFKVRTCNQNPFGPADVQDLIRKGRIFFSNSNEDENEESIEKGNVYVKFRQRHGLDERHPVAAFKEPLKALLKIPGKIFSPKHSVISETDTEKPESEYKYITYNENSWFNQLSDAIQSGELGKAPQKKIKLPVDDSQSEEDSGKPKPENILKSFFLGVHGKDDKVRSKRSPEDTVAPLPLGKSTYELTTGGIHVPGMALNGKYQPNLAVSSEEKKIMESSEKKEEPNETPKNIEPNKEAPEEKESKEKNDKDATPKQTTENETKVSPTTNVSERMIPRTDDIGTTDSTTRKRHVYDWPPSTPTDLNAETSTDEEMETDSGGNSEDTLSKVTNKRDIYNDRYAMPTYYPYWAKRGADYYVNQMSQKGERVMSRLDNIESEDVLKVYGKQRSGCDENKSQTNNEPKAAPLLGKETSKESPKEDAVTKEFWRDIQNPPTEMSSEQSKFRSILSELMKTINERAQMKESTEGENESISHNEEKAAVGENVGLAEHNDQQDFKSRVHDYLDSLSKKPEFSHSVERMTTDKEEPCHKSAVVENDRIQERREELELEKPETTPFTHGVVHKPPVLANPIHSNLYQIPQHEKSSLELPVTPTNSPKDIEASLVTEDFKKPEHKSPIVFITRSKIGNQGFQSQANKEELDNVEADQKSLHTDKPFDTSFNAEPPKGLFQTAKPTSIPSPLKPPSEQTKSNAPMPVIPNLRSQHEPVVSPPKPSQDAWKPKLLRPGVKPFSGLHSDDKPHLFTPNQHSHIVSPHPLPEKPPTETKAAPDFKNILPHLPTREMPAHQVTHPQEIPSAGVKTLQNPTLKMPNEVTTPVSTADKSKPENEAYLIPLSKVTQGIIFNHRIYPAKLYGMFSSKEHKDYLKNGHLILSQTKDEPKVLNLKDIVMPKHALKKLPEDDQVSEASSHVPVTDNGESVNIVILPQESVRKIMKDNPDLFSKTDTQVHRRKRSIDKSEIDNAIRTQIEEVKEIENEIMSGINKISSQEKEENNVSIEKPKEVLNVEKKNEIEVGNHLSIETPKEVLNVVEKKNNIEVGNEAEKSVEAVQEESKPEALELDDEGWLESEEKSSEKSIKKDLDDDQSDWKAKQLFIPLLLSRIKNVLDLVQKLVTSSN